MAAQALLEGADQCSRGNPKSKSADLGTRSERDFHKTCSAKLSDGASRAQALLRLGLRHTVPYSQRGELLHFLAGHRSKDTRLSKQEERPTSRKELPKISLSQLEVVKQVGVGGLAKVFCASWKGSEVAAKLRYQKDCL